jgi:predicted RNase H-like HicB family nuclease
MGKDIEDALKMIDEWLTLEFEKMHQEDLAREMERDRDFDLF